MNGTRITVKAWLLARLTVVVDAFLFWVVVLGATWITWGLFPEDVRQALRALFAAVFS